ncbi:dienelactone hydrolase family protein [Methanolobus halotolerans]|uniref:Hydrolase n=1 Tax=Methanolobus halotolerans TaxID=2052935 RepID=A0A4E0PZU6_9EURY|nr:dienelactone hydrolase family protein [Methanolobus halotolerans]TGC09505.1 hydrolase [Methanolobus halotolerans]
MADKEENSVKITIDSISLGGNLDIPGGAKGIVIFAHGSGSSRFSPRNRFVAGYLQGQGLATLLFDLLTPGEEEIDNQTAQFRFDIEMLAERLVAVTDWVVENPATANLKIGYFGASTGAAAALIAASERPGQTRAVVSRGGRPDLADRALANVKAPTLLIVGNMDSPVIEMNKWALERLDSEKRMELVRGATHLFEEPGTLEEAARLAGEWFSKYLGSNKG